MVRMTFPYEMSAIAPDVLRALRERDDAGNAPRMVLDEDGGNPMRCCLGRSKPGETVALVSYAPLARWAEQTGAKPGPYSEVGPVFIHLEDCGGAAPEVAEGAFPEGVRGKHRVLRAYDAEGSIRAAGSSWRAPRRPPRSRTNSRSCTAIRTWPPCTCGPWSTAAS